jgi:hypothetical protein
MLERINGSGLQIIKRYTEGVTREICQPGACPAPEAKSTSGIDANAIRQQHKIASQAATHGMARRITRTGPPVFSVAGQVWRLASSQCT